MFRLSTPFGYMMHDSRKLMSIKQRTLTKRWCRIEPQSNEDKQCAFTDQHYPGAFWDTLGYIVTYGYTEKGMERHKNTERTIEIMRKNEIQAQ